MSAKSPYQVINPPNTLRAKVPKTGGPSMAEMAADAEAALREIKDNYEAVVQADEEARPEVADESSGGSFDTESVPLFDEEALDQLRGAIGCEVFHQVLKLVPGESERLLNDIQWALGKGDLSTTQQYAHSLKGMAGNYAVTRIAAVAREFDFETQTPDAAKEKTAALKRAIDEPRQWIEESA